MTIEELYNWAMDNDVEDLELYVDDHGFANSIDEDNLEIYESGVVITNV